MSDFERVRRVAHGRWRIDWWEVFARAFFVAGALLGAWLYWETLGLVAR